MTEPTIDLDLLLELHVAEAARRYVAARVEADGASPGELTGAAIDVDLAWHDLLIAAGEPCGCDPGTCPDDDEREPSTWRRITTAEVGQYL